MAPTTLIRAHVRTVFATTLCAVSLTAFSPAISSATPETTAHLATGLVGDIADAQSGMDRLALEIGGLHEEVNKALVDLHDAQASAEQARQAVLIARAELDETQGKIEVAQARLDEISRAAYRRTTTPTAVATLAGEDASNDSLDRRTYLRTHAEKQRAAIAELDKLRTEQANRESQLRLARDLAEQREARALTRETDTRAAIEANNAQISVLAAERDRLAAEREAAQTQLDDARNEIAAGNAAQQDAEEYRAADAARKEAEDLAATDAAAAAEARRVADEEAAAAEAARIEAADAAAAAAAAEAAAEAARESEAAAQAREEQERQQAQEREAAARAAADAVAAAEAARESEAAAQAREEQEREAAAQAESRAQEQREQAEREREERERREAEAEAAREAARQAEEEARVRAEARERAEREAADRAREQEQAQAFRDAATAAAVAAAAAVIAQSEPDHTSLENPYPSVTDEETAPADIAAVQNPAALAEDDAQTSADVTTAPVIDTIEDVTEAAADEVAAIGDRSAQIEAVIARAESQLGLPYAWGGGNANGPTQGIRDGGVADSFGDFNKVGFDCSGLVLYAFAGAGIALPHYTGYQYNHGTKVSTSQMERGDLIFWGPGGSHHVAIYLGDGMMLEAPNSGSVVKKSPVRWSGMAEHAVRLI